MGKTNVARVILGGLLAGLILNIFEYVLNGVVFASQWDAFEKMLGRQMRPGAIPFFVVATFVMGIGVAVYRGGESLISNLTRKRWVATGRNVDRSGLFFCPKRS